MLKRGQSDSLEENGLSYFLSPWFLLWILENCGYSAQWVIKAKKGHEGEFCYIHKTTILYLFQGLSTLNVISTKSTFPPSLFSASLQKEHYVCHKFEITYFASNNFILQALITPSWFFYALHVFIWWYTTLYQNRTRGRLLHVNSIRQG